MRIELVVWAGLALLLMAAEAVLPGVFLLWLGLAAAAMFLILLAVDLPLVWQALLFVVLGFVSIGIYIGFFRRREKPSDHPTLNRRGEQLVGQVLHLDQAIVDGRGRVKVGDAFWVVEGPDLPVGARVRVVAANSMALQVRDAG